MNCWDLLCLVLGEENLYTATRDADLQPDKISVNQDPSIIFTMMGAFLVTKTGHLLVVLPTLASTDPLHLGIALHEAIHAKRWQEGHHGITSRYWLCRLWEEWQTNREAKRLTKAMFQGETRKDVFQLLKVSDQFYNPLVTLATMVLMTVNRADWIRNLMARWLDWKSHRQTGLPFAEACQIYMDRIQAIPENHTCDRCLAEQAA